MNFNFIAHKQNKGDSKNEKKQIWLYALILFTGAFIILLLTAYSQDKFQDNISEIQSKLSSEQKAKSNVATDLTSAVNENKRLTKEIESLRNKIIASEEKIATGEENYVDLESKYNNTTAASDLLLYAREYYDKKNYISCAITLKYDINTTFLSPKAMESYNELALKCYEKASKLVYADGYRNYKNKEYNEAITNFKRAIDFSKKDEYYVDDAYYYLANSYYKTLNFDEAKKIIHTFIIDYPRSSFLEDMKDLFDKMV